MQSMQAQHYGIMRCTSCLQCECLRGVVPMEDELENETEVGSRLLHQELYDAIDPEEEPSATVATSSA